MKKTKTIYKARYVIDINIPEEVVLEALTYHPMSQVPKAAAGSAKEKAILDRMEKMFSITQVSAKREIPLILSEAAADLNFDYVEEHFPFFARLLYFKMFIQEASVLHCETNEEIRSMRKKIIDRIATREGFAVRKRLNNIRIGAPSKREASDFEEQRQTFLETFVESACQIWDSGKKESQNKIAMAWPKWSDRDDRNRGSKMVNAGKILGFTYDELLNIAKERRRGKN